MNAITNKYNTDPWLDNLHTTIRSCTPTADGWEVILADTIFYPTGGGQPHDLGSINDVPLLNVFQRDGLVYHVLPTPLEPGPAQCRLDWKRRLDHMQQHTGQHLLSAVFLAEYGYHTESFHLGADYSSIDISTARLPEAEQIRVEDVANDLIFRNLKIDIYSATPTELQRLPVRKLPDLAGDLRIVEIDRYDYSPCSGTHLSGTGQIGLLKLLRAENYKGMTRVHFLCGGRARQDYRFKHETCTELGALLSVPVSELLSRSKRELSDKRDLERQMTDLQSELMDWRARSLVSEGNHCPLVAKLPEGSPEDAHLLARSVLNLGTFSIIVKLQNHVILAHNLSGPLHCGRLVKEYALPLGGRGGGSAFSAQAFFPEPERKEEFCRLLLKRLK